MPIRPARSSAADARAGPRFVRRRARRDEILQRVLVEHLDEGAERGVEDAVDRRGVLDQAFLVQLAEAIGLDVRLLGQPHDVADADIRGRRAPAGGRRGGRASS